MNNMNKELDELEVLMFNSAYQVDLKECSSDLEIRNERIAAYIAQKYNLIYRQGDGISVKTSESIDELKSAREEIAIYMPVGEIHLFGETISVYFFTFDSTTNVKI